ncbi:hypothetical protein ACFOD1_07685 [Pseudidiomarina halophila]|uniref:Uncharacterized protein n=2 Tax=Pseudidiomarina halophila TaxID=1449799 RepID=A0A432XRM1_9GAMM|nr:hypothetical protein CWI69_11690 [Pseudidiomarina halophila]
MSAEQQKRYSLLDISYWIKPKNKSVIRYWILVIGLNQKPKTLFAVGLNEERTANSQQRSRSSNN